MGELILAKIGLALLALFVTGLIFTVIVKITTTVGRYVLRLYRELQRRIALARMKNLIDAMKKQQEKEGKQANNDKLNKMKEELGEEGLTLWAEDENGDVIEDSIEIIRGEQVDLKTKKIMDENDGYITIAPMAV